MRRVGAFEAKARLAQLLDDVERGETIEITRHGLPVARLVPPVRQPISTVDATIAQIRQLRHTVEPLTQQEIRAMRDQGRRF